MRVLIIGAGLGGLSLLHRLRAAGIDAQVYERSAGEDAQPASYGIHLDADGLAALHRCLPAENWAMIDAAAVPAPYIIRFRDPRNGILSTVDRRFPGNETDPITRRRAISRGLLRSALLHGTGPVVHWGKRFVRYEEQPDGRVSAFFEDGARADGDVLVGADGANSRVRQQRLPELHRQDLGILNIAGRAPLTAELAAVLTPDMIDGGINNVIPPGSGWMFFSTWNTGDPGIADYSDGARQYIVWAWAAARTSYPAGIDDMTGPELKTLIQTYVRDWSGAYRAIVDHTRGDAVGPVPLRSMPHLPAWTPSTVTLLGDAIHNMTPMAGIGANTALRDAQHLGESLVSDRGTPVTAIGAYESIMRVYANKALALSTRNASGAALSSPTGRAAFRTVLRAGSVFPPLKRRMFGPTSVPVG